MSLIFWHMMYSGSRTDKSQGQGHHFCEIYIMCHNFWTGSRRDFWLHNVPYIIPLLQETLRFDVRRYVFTSRDFKQINENYIMGHNIWTGSDRVFCLVAKCFDVRRHVFASRDFQKNHTFLEKVNFSKSSRSKVKLNVNVKQRSTVKVNWKLSLFCMLSMWYSWIYEKWNLASTIVNIQPIILKIDTHITWTYPM